MVHLDMKLLENRCLIWILQQHPCRKKPEKEIQDMFVKAYFENPLMAVKWLFYLRDIRWGSGERRSFTNSIGMPRKYKARIGRTADSSYSRIRTL